MKLSKLLVILSKLVTSLDTARVIKVEEKDEEKEEEEEEEEEDKMPNHAATWFRQGERERASRRSRDNAPRAHTQQHRLKLREDTLRVKGVCSFHTWVDVLHKLNISGKF